MTRSLVVLLTVLTVAAAAAAGPTGPSVTLALAHVWAFRVRSATVLADSGYAIDYLFEFADEEELRVLATSPRAEILEGQIRTIIDGDPVLATIKWRGENLNLQITRDRYVFVASWILPDRLAGADLPGPEIERRWMTMIRLLQATRRRLGLEQFDPSRDVAATLRVARLDTLELTPVKETPERYEIARPGSPAARETLVTIVADHRWDITWGESVLSVRVSPIADEDGGTTAVSLRGRSVMGVRGSASLPTAEARQIASKAVGFLDAARTYFGTSSIVPPLPRVSR